VRERVDDLLERDFLSPRSSNSRRPSRRNAGMMTTQEATSRRPKGSP